MTTQRIKVYVHKYTWDDKLHAFSGEVSGNGCILIGTHEFDYEIPAGFNPVAAEVAMLQKLNEKTADEHVAKVAVLKGRIAELLCIENNPTVTA